MRYYWTLNITKLFEYKFKYKVKKKEMNDFHLKSHLHFGATIHISCFKERTNFYIYSNGISFKTLMSLSASDGPIEPSKCLFTIVPAIKFQSEGFLQKILKNKYLSNENIEMDQKQTKIFIDQFDFELQQNNEIIEQQMSDSLKYGQNFMLQHRYSSKYLSYVKDEESNEFVLQLSEIPTSNCIFNMRPSFNYQKQINTYIPFDSAAFLNIKIHEGLQIREMFLNYKENSVFDSWQLSEQERQIIKMGLYETAEEVNYKNICFGDAVWLFHLETGSFMKVIDKAYEMNNFALNKIKFTLGFLNERKMKDEMDDDDNDSIDIFLQKAENEMSAEKFGLWKIVCAQEKNSSKNQKDHSERFIGGKVKFDQEIRFFNIKYETYLSVRKKRVSKNRYEFRLATQKTEEQNTIFKITNFSNSSLYPTTEDLFLIQNVLTETYLSLSKPFKINENMAELSPLKEYKKEDYFKFTKVDFIQNWQNSYILSILPFIDEGIKSLKEAADGFTTRRSDMIFKLLAENLIEMLIFSYDLTEGFEASESKLGKMTYNHYHIQKLLRQQGVISSLVQLLNIVNVELLERDLMSKSNDDESLKITGVLKLIKKFSPDVNTGHLKEIEVDPKLLKKIVNISLKILRNCCKFNTQNSLYLFNHISVFIKYLSLNTYAENFFIDSFHNQYVLQKITDKQFLSIINQYVKIYGKYGRYSHSIFHLLRSFVTIEGRSFSKNQLQIFRLFFQKGNPLVIPIQPIDDRFFVTYNHEKVQLNQFCQINPEIGLYLANQIQFYAYLTYDRNYVCSKTIKLIFPLQHVLKYMINNPDTNDRIRQSFLWLVIHSYLNQRPRFKEFNPLVFSIHKRNSFDEMEDEGRKRRESISKQIPKFQVQMQMMQNRGISRQKIEDILSCIHQGDSMDANSIRELKGWVIDQIKQIMSQNELSVFYSSKMETCLTCLKYLIELSVFQSKEESNHVQELLYELGEQMGKSLVLNETIEKLESSNFRQLLLEMVQKNVIKKFNYSVKYDGIEDEVKPDNICSIFVNYSFYQNILLQEQNPQKRKETDNVIKISLELITLNSQLTMENKIGSVIKDIIENQRKYKYSLHKEEVIREILLNKALVYSEGKQKLYTLLILLFYNSNTYDINYKTINLFLKETFSDETFVQTLQRIIFIVDEQEEEQYQQILNNYKSLRLLIETSQIWLSFHNINERQPEYDSLILKFINKIKSTLKIVVPGFEEEKEQILCSVSGLMHRIEPDKQIILSNLNLQHEVIQFIYCYKPLLRKIKERKVVQTDNPLITLFKSCFLFLYVFIYNCPENKGKIREAIHGVRVEDYFQSILNIELGQTMFLIQYLKNNYEECIYFYSKKLENIQKNLKYTQMHSQLLVKLFTYYDEPILVNLKKFFISIFDFSSFKNYLWLKNGSEFDLNIMYFEQNERQPYFYHINALETILILIEHLPESRNTIKNHIRKSLKQDYLYEILKIDDYYTKQTSFKTILKISIFLKTKVIRLIQFAYMTDEERDELLVHDELLRMKNLLEKFIREAPARQETSDFRKVVALREMRKEEKTQIDKKIDAIYALSEMEEKHLLQIYLNSFIAFCDGFEKHTNHITTDPKILNLKQGCIQIKNQVEIISEILHKKQLSKQKKEEYPIPNQWLFSLPASNKDEESLQRRKYTSSFFIEAIFNQKVYKQIERNQQKFIQKFVITLQKNNLKEFFFLRKISQFIEDAFQKLPNDTSFQIFNCLKMLIQFTAIWIQSSPKNSVNQLRNQIGKSEMIFPILNYFQTCHFSAQNKELFLDCLQFYNELIGQQGNKVIQTIFNQYFKNKTDSYQFFIKIKQIFDQLNFQDRAIYKCKKLADGIQAFSNDVKLKKQPEFILLNFLIRLCKGNFRQNQIFLSSLRNISNFNIMNGIWDILKYENQKHSKNLINVQNYTLITQCFSTIRQLVQGPCVENQNEFIKRDFFLTIIDFFKFEEASSDLTFEPSLQIKLYEMEQISSEFTQKLRVYLNRDKITQLWMPSQVKYRCVSLICSLFSENVTQATKSQLYSISPQLIVKELNKVYSRYMELGIEYSYENLEVIEESEIILPLGFKLYELLQYYPKDKIPQNSQGLNFFKEHSKVVEVVHNDKLSAVIFPQPPPPNEISDAFKTQFLEQVPRTSVNSKLKSLQDAEIKNRQSDYPYGYLLFLLVIGLTVSDLILFVKSTLSFVKDFNFFLFLRIYGVETVEEGVSATFLCLILFFSLIFFILQIKGAVYLKQQLLKVANNPDLNCLQKFKQMLIISFKNFSYFYYWWIFIFAILSCFSPFFDTLLLTFQLYRRSQTFSAIIRAIASSIDQLMVVLLLTLVCTYILTSIIYYYSASAQFPNECATLYYCFVFSLDNGFRADAGIVGYTDDEDTILTDFLSKNFLDVLINFIYLFVIKVLIDQIIGAIMVDKFAEIRAEKQKLQEDENSNCFICGLERNLLDREEDGFEFHKEEYHNVWNYFEFLIHLRKNQKSTLSGIELYVFREQQNGRLNWFPINRSLHLQMRNQDNQQEGKENSLDKLTKMLDTQINGLRQNLGDAYDLLNIRIAKQSDLSNIRPSRHQK